MIEKLISPLNRKKTTCWKGYSNIVNGKPTFKKKGKRMVPDCKPTKKKKIMGKLIIKIGEKIVSIENFLKRKWNSFLKLLTFKVKGTK